MIPDQQQTQNEIVINEIWKKNGIGSRLAGELKVGIRTNCGRKLESETPSFGYPHAQVDVLNLR